MRQNIKLLFINNRNFFKIIRYTLLSFVLLIITWLLDFRYPLLKQQLPSLILLSPEVANSFLSTLSGVFLTVTTFTLTTIITVLNKYASSFTPRVVQDFIDKPNVLSLFSIFIGGFFYTVLSLFMLHNIDHEVKVVSGTIGIFYAIASMIAFILFVRRVLKDIKTSSVIDNIYNDARKLVATEADQRKNSERYSSDNYEYSINIPANSSGYLYEIDKDRLLALIKDFKCEVVIERKIGDYVPKGIYVATLNYLDNPDLAKEDTDKLVSEISKTIVTNTSKNESQDYHHEITNLVEIAMKALSPGINDPNTAIAAIAKISMLLGHLFSSDNYFLVLKSNENAKIVYTAYSVEEELYYSFTQILHYAKNEPFVASAILEGLFLIYMISNKSAEKPVVEFFEYTYDQCQQAMDSEMDKNHLEKIYKDFKKNKDNRSDEKEMRD